MRRESDLPPGAAHDAIRSFLDGSETVGAQLQEFKRYVPTRFLTPWFADKLGGQQDARKDGQIRLLARESKSMPGAALYFFEGDDIVLDDSWQAFLFDNLALVQAFAEHHFTLYLQARNPNVPGIPKKLRIPPQRNLTAVHRFWSLVRAELVDSGQPERFHEIYSAEPLGGRFSINHFLPWSFVAHDLAWNLAPVSKGTNSSKGDRLPDLSLYLPRLARLHYHALQALKSRPRLFEDYTDCFKENIPRLTKAA